MKFGRAFALTAMVAAGALSAACAAAAASTPHRGAPRSAAAVAAVARPPAQQHPAAAAGKPTPTRQAALGVPADLPQAPRAGRPAPPPAPQPVQQPAGQGDSGGQNNSSGQAAQANTQNNQQSGTVNGRSPQQQSAGQQPAGGSAQPAPQPASDYGCAAALAYLSAHAAPGFTFECPGYAWGHQAMTCVNHAPQCPGTKVIAIAVPCAAAYKNEASNSWVLLGMRQGAIDPYGYCP